MNKKFVKGFKEGVKISGKACSSVLVVTVGVVMAIMGVMDLAKIDSDITEAINKIESE